MFATRQNDLPADTPRIALFGTFDVDNFGDCLFPLVVEHQLTRRLGKLLLLPFSPMPRSARIANYPRVFGFHEFAQEARHIALVLIGGGALLTTAHAISVYPGLESRAFAPALTCWLLPLMLAETCGIPAALNAVGLGPMDARFHAIISRYLERASLFSVRDPLTAERMETLGLAPEVFPDSAILTPELFQPAEWQERAKALSTRLRLPDRFLAVQASFPALNRAPELPDALAEICRLTDYPAVAVPLCHHHSDRAACRILASRLRQCGVTARAVDAVLPTLDTAALLSKAQGFIGTSLHGAWVSLAFRRPAVSITPEPHGKRWGVMSVIGLERCCVNDPWEAPSRFDALSKRVGFAEVSTGVDAGTVAAHTLFDRLAGLVESNRLDNGDIPFTVNRRTWHIECPPIADDLHALESLCRDLRNKLRPLSRVIQRVCRLTPVLSESYDAFMWRCRKSGLLKMPPRKPFGES